MSQIRNPYKFPTFGLADRGKRCIFTVVRVRSDVTVSRQTHTVSIAQHSKKR
jgi:hypothetical protein